MRFLAKLGTVLGAAAMIVPLAVPGSASSEIVVSGGGWGHGIGMPQYGAKALADSGDSAEEIVTYFYTGTSIGTVGSGGLVGHADPLRIGLIQDKSIVYFSPVGGSITLCIGDDCTLTATAGDGLNWSIRAYGGLCQFYNGENPVGPQGSCQGSINWVDQPGTQVYFPTLGDSFARGEILVRPALSGRFHVVVELGLEDYLYGVAEMPSGWAPKGLQAQAIASRTYALYKAWVYRNLSANQAQLNKCGCHLYGSTKDQKYVGWEKESETIGGTNYGAKWIAAVDATAGKALVHSSTSGRAIQAYFYSSSGGATENNEDVWGGSPLPYLRSVPDPGPSTWTKIFDSDVFASLLGFVTVDSATVIGTFTSGSPTAIVVSGTGSGGPKEATFTGNELRSKLGLRSHYVTDFSGLCPENGAGGDHLLHYAGESGSYDFVDVEMSGCVIDSLKSGSFASGWTHIEAVDLTGDGDDELLFYRKSDGRYVYYELSSSGSLGTKLADGYWGTGWDSVEPLNFGSNAGDELLFYRKSDGRFGYYNLTSLGVIGSAVRIGYFGAGWTGVEPVAIHGDDMDEMLFYRKSDGRFAFYNLTSAGTIGTSIRTGWMGLDWDIVEPADLDGDSTDELVYYRGSNGRYAAYDLNPGGFIGSALGVGYYSKNLAAITSPAS